MLFLLSVLVGFAIVTIPSWVWYLEEEEQRRHRARVFRERMLWEAEQFQKMKRELDVEIKARKED